MATSEVLIAEHENVKISKCNHEDQPCMIFRFSGKLTHETAQTAVESWSEFQTTTNGSKFVHVWDCTRMSGFEIQAKDLWLAQLKANKDFIQSIKIVSDNIVIRGAARLIAKVTSHPLETFKSNEDLGLN
jgi:hypothetical protein